MKSDLDNKKYKAIFYNKDRSKVKTTHFGAKGMNDYTIHKDDERKERYLARHKVNEDWNDYTSAGSLSRYLLWNKPSLSASFNDYLKKFKLKKY
jgi:hypothetical protein